MRISETHNVENSMLRRIYLSGFNTTWAQKKKSYLIFKRIIDILFSLSVSLVVLSWLIPVLALVIKLDSKGPVFFIQQRIGWRGRRFGCIKFRSMVVNSEADSAQACNNDPRITRLGKFLRISCIDELPQFFNVLIGDMSIVGPRPHMISDCLEFKKQVPDYDFRHSMKPGITGMAQVKGYRGKTNGYFDVFHRYQWDAFYVRNANILLDIRLMYQTFRQTLSATLKFKKEKKTVSAPSLPASSLKQIKQPAELVPDAIIVQ